MHFQEKAPTPSGTTRPVDLLLATVGRALQTLAAPHRAVRANPALDSTSSLSVQEQKDVGGLMRVNHVGEVCAQALYTGQALGSRDPFLQAHLWHAADDETNHLAWTEQRLAELNDRPSLLNPLWYVGAFALGWGAARLGGDRLSLGFVVETEQQVAAHLDGHLKKIPPADQRSLRIVRQMKLDEAQHARTAQGLGAEKLPSLAAGLMRVAARVMTTVAYRV